MTPASEMLGPILIRCQNPASFPLFLIDEQKVNQIPSFKDRQRNNFTRFKQQMVHRKKVQKRKSLEVWRRLWQRWSSLQLSEDCFHLRPAAQLQADLRFYLNRFDEVFPFFSFFLLWLNSLIFYGFFFCIIVLRLSL